MNTEALRATCKSLADYINKQVIPTSGLPEGDRQAVAYALNIATEMFVDLKRIANALETIAVHVSHPAVTVPDAPTKEY